MRDLKKAAQQALKALVSSTDELRIRLVSPTDLQLVNNHKAIADLSAALAEPQESVQELAEEVAKRGWQYTVCPACGSECARAFPMPPQEPWDEGASADVNETNAILASHYLRRLAMDEAIAPQPPNTSTKDKTRHEHH